MNTEWVQEAVRRGFDQILANEDATTEDEIIAKIAREIRNRFVYDYNESLNRIRKAANMSIEQEREEVP